MEAALIGLAWGLALFLNAGDSMVAPRRDRRPRQSAWSQMAAVVRAVACALDFSLRSNLDAQAGIPTSEQADVVPADTSHSEAAPATEVCITNGTAIPTGTRRVRPRFFLCALFRDPQ